MLEEIKVQFDRRIGECEEVENRKFKQVQNLHRASDLVKGNYHRMSTIHGNTHSANLDETFFINKMNSMQEKISKI